MIAMGKTRTHPDPLPLELTADQSLEAEIERRVAARCQREAFHWKFRLIAGETIMIGVLVLTAGVTLGLPVGKVVRAAILVASSCFATGILLLGLSGAGVRLVAKLKGLRRT